VDEAYLVALVEQQVQKHQGVTMSWEDFKKHGTYKFILESRMSPSVNRSSRRSPVRDRIGQDRDLFDLPGRHQGLEENPVRLRNPLSPEVDRTLRIPQSPEAQEIPLPPDHAAPALAHPFDLQQHPWLRETYEQEVTINASDAAKLGVKTGDTVEVWNDRGKCVVPVYVTERCMPGVVVLFEGAWMDLDKNGVDRAGNPDFLTLDEPSPAGAFAYNTRWFRSRRPIWSIARCGTSWPPPLVRVPPRHVNTGTLP
jgi:anaerobic dimethyl sulfoxide reductase subunit A